MRGEEFSRWSFISAKEREGNKKLTSKLETNGFDDAISKEGKTKCKSSTSQGQYPLRDITLGTDLTSFPDGKNGSEGGNCIGNIIPAVGKTCQARSKHLKVREKALRTFVIHRRILPDHFSTFVLRKGHRFEVLAECIVGKEVPSSVKGACVLGALRGDGILEDSLVFKVGALCLLHLLLGRFIIILLVFIDVPLDHSIYVNLNHIITRVGTIILATLLETFLFHELVLLFCDVLIYLVLEEWGNEEIGD